MLRASRGNAAAPREGMPMNKVMQANRSTAIFAALLLLLVLVPLRAGAQTSEMQIELLPGRGLNLPGDEHTVTATVQDEGRTAVDVPVRFRVSATGSSGATPQPARALRYTGGDGQASFTFTSNTLGRVRIEACVAGTDVCDEGFKVFSSTPLLRETSAEDAFEQLQAFQTFANTYGGTRAASTMGYAATVGSVVGQMQTAGYDVTVQNFQFELFEELEAAVLEVVEPEPRTIETLVFEVLRQR